MNIETHFLQKAIKDRNLISFTYEMKPYKSIAPQKITQQESEDFLYTNDSFFKIAHIKKLKIHKEKY